MDAQAQAEETGKAYQQLEVWHAEAQDAEVQMQKLGQASQAAKGVAGYVMELDGDLQTVVTQDSA